MEPNQYLHAVKEILSWVTLRFDWCLFEKRCTECGHVLSCLDPDNLCEGCRNFWRALDLLNETKRRLGESSS